MRANAIENSRDDDNCYLDNCPVPPSNIKFWVDCLFGISIWTIVFGVVYLVGFLLYPYSEGASVPSHVLLYILSHSTHHDKFSFEMLPIASLSHGLHGWYSRVQLPIQCVGRYSAAYRRPSCIVVDLTRWQDLHGLFGASLSNF